MSMEIEKNSNKKENLQNDLNNNEDLLDEYDLIYLPSTSDISVNML